jgi:uncharacterized protein (DUF58 family)
MNATLAALMRVARPGSNGRIHITGRKIYILPTGYGVIFGVLILLLLIASINYANNPAFLLTFLLAGIFFQAIFHTWRNLKGLELRWIHTEPVFAGETALIRLRAMDPAHDHLALAFAFSENDPVLVDLPAGKIAEVEVPLRTARRGLLEPGRLTVESRYPLGLLRAWSLVETGATITVWPHPVHGPLAGNQADRKNAREGDREGGNDDFAGHRSYRPGDSAGHIHWKALAAEKGLLVKEFGSNPMDQLWLDFEALPSPNVEMRLSLLAGAVESLSRELLRYGLRLPDLEIPPSTGEAHRRRCLNALALFGNEEAAPHPRP